MLINHFYKRNECFSYEVLRAAGYGYYGGSDLGEVISICSRISSGNEKQWLDEWKKAGDRAWQNAEHSAAVGNGVSAHEAFVRASNYYRTAEFFRRENPFEDEIGRSLCAKSAVAFVEAMKHTPYGYEPIAIPFEDTTLPGYFMRPTKGHELRRTIIFNGGYDSTIEESWFAIGAAALSRGFNVLAFDGPGQGMALRKQRLFFRPDWETVLTPVMDYALTREEVDPESIVIFGWSMGGYLVARGATEEHRARAIILDDGIYDFGSAYRKDQPIFVQKLVQSEYDSIADFFFRIAQRLSTGIRWGLRNGKWAFGAASESEFIRKVGDYTLEGRCENIRTPCLVLDAVNDHFLKGQPAIFRDHLTCKYEFATLGVDEGADTHCHMGAFSRLHQIVFDYLERLLLENDLKQNRQP